MADPANVKTISFPGDKPLAIRFGRHEQDLFAYLEERSSAEVRALLGSESLAAIRVAADERGLSINSLVVDQLAASMDEATGSRPRWTGWPAGSARSLHAVREILTRSRRAERRFLDPFAGRANYPTVAAQLGIPADYCEASPVFRAVAEARVSALDWPVEARREFATTVQSLADALAGDGRIGPTDALLQRTARDYMGDLEQSGNESVGTAIDLLMQIRSASNAKPKVPSAIIDAAVVEALPRSARHLRAPRLRKTLRRELLAAVDFLNRESTLLERPRLVAHQACELATLPPLGVSVVVTNPPWLNFADYSSPLASWYLGVRRQPVRSLSSDDALERIVTALDGDRGEQLGRTVKKYAQAVTPRMAPLVANYFAMIGGAFAAIAKHLTPDAVFAFESTSSEFAAGVKIPTPDLLEQMLSVWGFERLHHRDEYADFIVMRRG